MVAVDDIGDEDSLTAWLEARPAATRQREAVTIAFRAAARVLPVYLNAVGMLANRARISDLTELPHIRTLMLCSVAARASTPDIKKNLSSAAAAAHAASAEIASGFEVIHNAGALFAGSDLMNATTAAVAAAASFVADPDAAEIPSAAAKAAAASVESGTALATVVEHPGGWFFWNAIRTDCALIEAGEDPLARPLWHGEPNPLAETWAEVRAAWEQDGAADWSFWVRWYESLLDPATTRPLPPELLERIALKGVDEAERGWWDRPPAEVNADIMAMWEEFALSATYNAERIELNPETGKLRVVPETGMAADMLEDVVAKLREANAIFDNAPDPNRMYEAIRPERDLVERALDRHAEHPLRLFDACRRAEKRILARIAAGECAEGDPLIEDYVEQLREAALDIHGFDPKVKEVVANRMLDRMGDLPAEQRDAFVAAADEMAEHSEGELAEELPEDARKAVDPDTPEDERKEALNRTAGRMLRAWQLLRKGLADGAKLTTDVTKVVGGVSALGAAIYDGYMWATTGSPKILPLLLSLF